MRPTVKALQRFQT